MNSTKKIFGTAVHLDPDYVKFVGQGHRSKFTVTGGKIRFSAEGASEIVKTISSISRKADLNLKLNK